MDCPKCEGKLQAALIAGLSLQTCSKCGGMWLRYGQLRPLLDAWAQGSDLSNARYNGLEATSRRYSVNTAQLMGPCPQCPAPTLMIPVVRDIGAPIRVDYCQRGHGLWLDATEIRQIRSRLLNKPADVPEAMAHELQPNDQAA